MALRNFFRRLAAVTGTAAMLLLGIAGYYETKLPDSFYVEEGKDFVLYTQPAIQQSEILTYDRISTANRTSDAGETVEMRLWGVIPIKTTHLNRIDRPVVMPGGTPFGIKLFTEGVMVIDLSDIETDQGLLCPAKEANIREGDVVLAINGELITSNEQIAEIIAACNGNSLSVDLERDGQPIRTTLTPARACTDGKFKSGIWVRDSSAGIGTITYYMPEDGQFAGLGHGICDIDTGKLMPLHEGEVCKVKINSVQKGQIGIPGELKGSFASSQACGKLTLNSEVGVFGTLDEAPNACDAVPIKLKQEIKVGDATILCTLDDGKLGEYTIHIDRVDLNPNTLTKNMIISVTDPGLLQKTGGIVQGMSGSPIIQDGKLVGAVTHVFVNDPTRGYGIFAENMLEAAG